MHTVLTRRLLSGRLFFGLLLCCLLACGAVAQVDCKKNPNVLCEDKKPAPTPTPGSRPPGGRRGARTPVQTVARPAEPLELQWWLLRVDNKGTLKPVNLIYDGAKESISINETFLPNQQLRLAVKAEQDGYLYVIHQTGAGADGRLLFPSRYYKSAEGLVRKGQTFYLPDGLDSPVSWLSLPTASASQTLRLIFSRERIKELPNPSLTMSGDVPVNAQLIENMLKYSPKELAYTVGYPNNVAKVTTRANGAANKNLVEVLTLSGTGADKAAAAAPAAQN